MFQHDNDSKHTAKSTTEWLEDNEIEVLKGWPTHSPDLNPRTNVEWNGSSSSGPPKPSDANELWEGIEPEFCQNLFLVCQRLADVRKVKGGYTSW